MAKILVWDIESTNLVASIGNVLCIGYKWYGKGKPTVLSIRDYPDFKKDPTDDRRLVKDFAKIFNEAEMQVTWYGCPALSERVLTSDLRWVPSGDLKVGDRLLAVEDKCAGFGLRRRYVESEVTYAQPAQAPSFIVRFKSGECITVSETHPLLVTRNIINNNTKWIEARHLRPGDKVCKLMDEWSEDTSYGSGYLAGMFDGEGHISFQQRKNNRPFLSNIGLAQKKNAALESVKNELGKRGFSSLGWHVERDDLIHLCINGGRAEHLRFLGSIRPKRLLDKFDISRLGSSLSKEWLVVDCLEPVKAEIMKLSTTSETYIVSGLPSHNSRFDFPYLQSRLLWHGMEPLPEIRHFDGWWVAKKKLKLHSNRLATVQDFLDLPSSKTPLNFRELSRSRAGHIPSLKSIEKHCYFDVEVLEQAYDKIKSYAGQYHPNLAAITGEHENCPTCGSDKLQRRGFKYAHTRVYRQIQCQECGRWFQSTRCEPFMTAKVV